MLQRIQAFLFPPDRRIIALEHLVHHDEASFVAVYQALDPAERQEAIAHYPPNYKRLIRAAYNADRPDALEVLRQDSGALAVRETRDRRAAIFAAAIRYDDMHLGVLVLAEPRPRLARRLAERSALAPTDYMGAYPLDPALGLAWVRAGRISPQQYCEKAELTEERAIAEVLDGRLTVDELLDVMPRPSSALMEQLRANVVVSDAQYLRSGTMPDAEIQARIAEAVWTPLEAVGLGPVPETLAMTWLKGGDMAAYVAASVRHWQPSDPIPEANLRHAAQYASRAEMVAGIPMPGPAGSTVRLSYALRVVAHHNNVQPIKQTIVSTRWAGVSNFRRFLATYLGAPAPQMPVSTGDNPPPECIVCYQTMAGPGRRGQDCQHDASMCADCVGTAVTTQGNCTCPYPDCNAHFSPNDLLALNLDTVTIDRVLYAGLRPPSANWRACPTRGCVGGCDAALGTTRDYTCSCCAKVTLFLPLELADPASRAHMARLVEGALSPNYVGQIRQCYHCGVDTEHTGGCSHMRCRSCLRDWSMVNGVWNTSFGQGSQRYVPKAGTMVAVGLYNGLIPGATHVDIAPVLRSNAQRLGLLNTPGTER